MSATTSIPQQKQPKPGFRKIMTWNNSKRTSKKLPHLSYDSAPEGDDKTSPVPASPTHSLRSIKSGRPSLFATFARRNSTKSEHSSRSRSPTSPRPSNDLNFVDGIRTPSPTPSRNSMIFERDIEFHDHLSVHEAIDLAIPPVLDDAAEAFVNEEINILQDENADNADNTDNTDDADDADEHKSEHDGKEKASENGSGKQKANSETPRVSTLIENEGRKRLSLLINYGDIANGRTPSPSPFDHTHTLSETLRVTTPREMKGLTGIFDNPGK